MEKMFVIVIPSTTAVNGLLRADMLQAWVVTSKYASMFVLPVGTWACGSGQDRAFKKLGSIRNSNLSVQVPSPHCVAEQHSFPD